MSMKLSDRLLFIYILLLLALSCQRKDFEIQYNIEFDEISAIAKAKRKPFCIVLANSSCPPCEFYLERLTKKRTNLTSKAVFNIVDTNLPENEWYKYWICSMASPVTCVFSESGTLTSIVKGAAWNSFECIERSVDGKTDCATYTYDSPFNGLNFNESIYILNKILKYRIQSFRGEDVNEIDIDGVSYPYSKYLQMLDAQKRGDSQGAVRYAEQMLLTRNIQREYRQIYAALYLIAKRIINPDYDPSCETTLVSDSTVRLPYCEKGVSHHFSITVSNSSRDNLTIDDIWTSCDCLTLKSEKSMLLLPGESKSLDFIFLGEEQGSVKRQVVIFSDAGNNPVKSIEINAIIN